MNHHKFRKMIGLVLPCLAAATLVVGGDSILRPALTVNAAAFIVNSTTDASDANAGNGVCESAPGNGICTLRAAIQEANALPGNDDIVLSAVTYTVTLMHSGDTGLPFITSTITIIGNHATILRHSGSPAFHVMAVFPPGNVTLQDVTIRGGLLNTFNAGGGLYNESGGVVTLLGSTITDNRVTGGGGGGGLFNRGVMNITNSTISGNSVINSGTGGGIENQGVLTVTNSTIYSNTARAGGGIANYSGNAAVSNSVFSNNRTENGAGGNNGGAIANFQGAVSIDSSSFWSNHADNGGAIIIDQGTATVTASTFSQNSGLFGGGALLNNGTTSVVNSTLAGNSSVIGGAIDNMVFGSGLGVLTLTNNTVYSNVATSGGGLFVSAGTVSLLNVILADDQPNNCAGPIVSLGYNLDSGNSCGLNMTGDITSTSPLLKPLADNGGSTLTMAIRPGSPALDQGTNVGCPGADQRGVARPLDGDHEGFAQCDIGAYEFDLLNRLFVPLLRK